MKQTSFFFILISFLLILVPAVSIGAAGPPAGLALEGPGLYLNPEEGVGVVVFWVANRTPEEIGPGTAVRVGRRPGPAAEWAWEETALGALPPGARLPLRIRLPLGPETAGTGLAVSMGEGGEGKELVVPAVADLLPPPLVAEVQAASSEASVSLWGSTGPGWEVEVFAAGEPAARVKAGEDGRFALALPLAMGPNRFAVRAVAAGVWPTRIIELPPIFHDPDPPEIAIELPAEGGCYRAVTPSYTVRDALATEIRATLDGAAYGGGAIITPGRHVLRVTARDAAGNLSSAARSFSIDAEPPRIAIGGLHDGWSGKGPVVPRLSAEDPGLRSFCFWIDGYPWWSGLPVTAPGPHLLRAAAEDEAGNRTERWLRFTIHGEAKGPSRLAEKAIAATLPKGARLLSAESGDLGPDSGPEAAAFFLDAAGAVRLAVLGSGRLWVAPGSFGRAEGRGREGLAIHLLDLEADGVKEIVADGPREGGGRRILVLRWQAGAWATIGEFAGEEALFFAGPSGLGRAAVFVRTGGRVLCWRRTNSPAGMGPQFAPAPGVAAPEADLACLAVDPGHAFLRPLRTPGSGTGKDSALAVRASVKMDDGARFVLFCGREGYRPALVREGEVAFLSPEPLKGEIGPSWRWPDPDGLFAADFDGDGEREVYFTLRQGEGWRMLFVYDLANGGPKLVLQARVRLPAERYAPGLRFLLKGERALVRLEGREEKAVLVWDGTTCSFRAVTEEPPAGNEVDLLGREFLVGPDPLAKMW